MTTRWSSDYNAIEIRDFDAHRMAIDYSGCIVMLAGRKKYGLVEIYKSSNILFPRTCKYEIKALEWNPTYHNQQLCALSQNTQLQLLSLKNSVSLSSSIRFCTHTRAILDINWHASDPNILASSSMDSYVNIWDIRDNSRPALSLSAIIPALRVRWNHLNKHLIATAHGGEVKIWDQRKAANPIHYITAHLSNIHCLDWSYTNENQLVTCSQDCTVKFFEINNRKKAKNILNTVTPVWSAKYTPFGDGILIVLVPPEKRVDNNLILWNLGSINSPVHTFVGHSDTILEFQWMRNNEDKTSEYEFITWSKDQTMRLWHIMSFLQEMPLDYIEKSSEDNLDNDQNSSTSETSDASIDALNETDNVNFDNEGQDGSFCVSASEDSYNTEKNEEPIVNLYQEFLSLNVGSEIFIEQKDPDRRILIALVKVNNNSITIHMTFPLDYPLNVEPQFQITKTTYDASMKNKIHKILYDSAIKQVSKNLTCVQFCLRELVVSLRKSRISFSESQFSEDDKKMYSQSPSHYERTSTYLSNQDTYNIIQHNTMGLKFCNNGALLWFNSPLKRKSDFFPSISLQKIDSANNTPLQKLQPYWFSNKNSPTDGSSRSSKIYRKDKPIVSIYDVSSLFPINKDLASKYELDVSNVFSTCLKNAWITNGFKRKDLVQTWTLAAYACNTKCNVKKKVTSSIDQINNWRNHPFTIHMIDSLIAHYAGHSDYQTAALLCCVFNPNPALKNIEQDRTPTPVYTRSNSLSEGFTFSRGQEESTECYEISDQGLLLEDSDSQKNMYYDVYKKIYMDVLDNLGLLDQQTSVKQFLKQQTQKNSVFFYNFVVDCLQCYNSVKVGYCLPCQKFNLKCTLCDSTVRGAAHVCLKCGHGGHANHLIRWFSKEPLCAVGCGCYCSFETMSLLYIKRCDTKED